MLTNPATQKRELLTSRLETDLVIVGGGLAGTCCALTAARAGIRVVLIQDRPVLGGNSSSEVRLWVLGATSHMANNNRWSREGGIHDEILVENLWRNPEGNALLFDTVLLEKVIEEPNITLLLNTACFECEKAGERISSVRAFCSQNSTMYNVRAPLFCDASGDGVLGFLVGAAFRMGAEASEEFGEKFAPSQEYGELLGHSLYFYSKDVGRPVRFVPPSYALNDITQIPRFRSFNAQSSGCRLWWLEYGGRLDTIHDTERIKWELWKVVYGVWDYIKNSGKFPEAENLTLEWVGHIPGKRESRRFEGDYLLRQQNIIEQTDFLDVVAYGGWSIDLHPADGVFSEKPGCNQWHSKGIYGIPYRSFYSRNVPNLFLAGRIISASHVAFGSTRVMSTCAHGAQAVGMAAALCCETSVLPRDLTAPEPMRELQKRLLRTGHHLPNRSLIDAEDLAQNAQISASSTFTLGELPADGPLLPLNNNWAQLIPVAAGPLPQVTFQVDVSELTTLTLELRGSYRVGNYTPDHLIERLSLPLAAGQNQPISFPIEHTIEATQYLFYCLMANPKVAVHTSQLRISGLLSVTNRFDVNSAQNYGQRPSEDIGVESFEFWLPVRRPAGHNLAFNCEPPLRAFEPSSVTNGVQRPTLAPNAWVASPDDEAPTLILAWEQEQQIERIELFFDSDYDHAMESVLMGHPERVVPFCVRSYRIVEAQSGKVLYDKPLNHQTRNIIRLSEPVTTRELRIEVRETWGAPAAIFEVRCYAPNPNKPLSNKSNTVLIFGDSITEGNMLPPDERSKLWLNLVETKSNGQLQLINEGKGGRPTDCLPEFKEMLQRHPQPDLLVIALGGNDARDISAQCVPKALRNLSVMVEVAHQHYGEKLPILLLGPTNIRKDALGPTKLIGNERKGKLRELNAAYAELAQTLHCDFASLYGVVPESTLTLDGVHPNAAGNEAIARYMLPILLRSL